MLALLAAALDGSGPAILPLDPELPGPALARALEEFAPSVLITRQGTGSVRLPAVRGAAAGVGDETAVVIATSGSTGVPKGVELSASALTASARASLRRVGAGAGQRWLCCLPTFHVAGIAVLVRSLLAGAGPVITAGVDAEILAASGCQHVSVVPTQLRRLLDASADPGGLGCVLVGGAAASGDLLAEARAAGWPIVTTYGMSETCGGCVYDGVPLDGVAVGFDADDRIEIAGPVLFSGYRLRPELTSAALRGGRFLTGG
jgi:o-succinylbenzoate---CoA ligase